MTHDFGSERRRKSKAMRLVLTGGAAVALVLGVLLIVGLAKYSAVSKAKAWSVAGPPCPSLSQAQYMAGDARIDHVLNYDDVLFGRGYGYASCTEIADHGGLGFGTVPICQFNAPTVLSAATRRGTFYYAVPIGPATVSIKDDRPECVMNASVGR